VRSDATALRAALQPLIHRDSWLTTHAERAVSRTLGGSCSVPLAAHAVIEAGRISLTVALGHARDPDQPLLRAQMQAEVADTEAAEALGRQAAQALLALGGADYLLMPG